MTKTFLHIVFRVAICVIVVSMLSRCQKEYSCEGCRGHANVDSIPLPPVVRDFPECTLCHESDALALSTWNFKTGNSYVCGVVHDAGAGIDREKKAFTFFGPSACSLDTGLVMTVYMPVPMDRSRSDITTSRVAFYYYDNNAARDIFISLSTQPFSLTVKSFDFSTGIAEGFFSGIVYRANGDTAMVRDGKFKVKLKY
ncbi:MAG TPA: hypothetical protein VGC95_04545 [Chitinophagaceae bacterium]|jgi:hypothetical protein